MNLIINNSDELKDLLGFVDADLNYNNMVSDLQSATRELIDIIGKPAYIAIKALESDTDQYKKEIYRLAQNVIAIRSYALFAPNNDLSHTNDGRKMRNEDGEKNAFEWMIEADNANLEKKYYRAVDDLIALMDESFEPWKNSDEYKKEKKLFVSSLKIFSDYHPISSRLLFMKFRPDLERCEKREILPIIGKLNFDKLKDGTLEDDDLLDLIREACVNYALFNTIPKLSINLLPDSIVQMIKSDRQTLKASKVPELSEQYNAMKVFKRIYDQVINEIQISLIDPDDISLLPEPANPNNKFFNI